MRKLVLHIDGKDIEVLAQKISGEVWFHLGGTTYQYTPKINQNRSSGNAAQDPTQILAPMPGKVIKIFVKEDQVVEEGDTVVAMEAMKMEYNLKATKTMKVKSIHCQTGAQVGLGDLLVALEEEDV